MRILLLNFLWFFCEIVFARVETNLRPNPPVMGQELQFVIRQYDKTAPSLPDFSVLHQDFDIVGSQQSVSYQSINGKSQRENMWTLILMPKHEGKITIPSIKLGDEMTEALAVEVKKAPIVEKNSGQDGALKNVFLDWHLSQTKPVVHEQVNLTLKIYHLQPLLDAKLQPPSVKNGLIFSLEQALRYFEMKNGVRYEVEEYRYVIYPQKIGKLDVSPPILDAIEYGLVPTPVHASLKPMTMSVEPPPQGEIDQSWLPAQKLTYQDLKPFSAKMGLPVGDTIVRQLQLTAVGIPAQLIPELHLACGDGCKVYLNPPKISNKIQNGNLTGRKTYNITYLFSQPGQQSIPAIKIPWFNTSTRQLEMLEIPGIMVDIFADSKTAKSDEQVHLGTHATTHISSWLFALLGFVLGGLLMKFQSRWSLQKGWKFMKSLEFEHYALKKACLNHQAEKARLEILAWSRKAGFKSTIYDLHDIVAELPPCDFREELKVLMTFLFSQRHNKKWHGPRFWRAFKAFKFKPSQAQSNFDQYSGLNP